MAGPEKKIEMEILQFLRSIGIFCWKVDRQGTYDAVRKTFRKNHNPFKIRGVSDILGVVPYYTPEIGAKSALGRLLAIEVKGPLGRCTPEQRSFLAKISEEGGIAFVARSVEQCATELMKHFPNNSKLKQFAEAYVGSRGADH